MITDRIRGTQYLVLLGQCLLATCAFWLWFYLCQPAPIHKEVTSRYLIYNEFMLLGLLVEFWRSRNAICAHIPDFEESSRRSFHQLVGALFYLLLYLVAARDNQVSRLFLFSFIPVLYLTLFSSHGLLPKLLGKALFPAGRQQKVLLMGPKSKALKVKRWIDQNRQLGFEVLGLLTDDVVPQSSWSDSLSFTGVGQHPAMAGFHRAREAAPDVSPSGTCSAGAAVMQQVCSPFQRTVARADLPEELPVLGRPDELERFVSAPGLMKVIVVEFPRTDNLRSLTEVCEARGVRLLVVADLDKVFNHPVAVFEDQGMFFIGLREEPLENPVNRFFKRCLDIAISLPVCVLVLPPLMLFVWICHRLQSPGPLFFHQPREGFHNEPFEILKFRTMHASACSESALPGSSEDPRLFPMGSFLRKTSIDEMPQFWNVLEGQMSVVGPRPHMPCYNQQYRKIYYRAYVRSFVKPGITGLAQARGFRGSAETPEDVVRRMESDLEYLENWSFWLDCWLILRTPTQMLFPPRNAV